VKCGRKQPWPTSMHYPSIRDLLQCTIPAAVTYFNVLSQQSSRSTENKHDKPQSWSEPHANPIGSGVVAIFTSVYKTVCRRIIQGVLCKYHVSRTTRNVRFEDLTAVKMTMLHLWVVRPSSALKMKTVCFSEKFVSTYESTQRHNPDEQHRQQCNYAVHHVSVANTLSSIPRELKEKSVNIKNA
jgi:hypothetical protein